MAKKENKQRELLFSRDNFIFMGVGLLLVVIGFFLMSGGNMPDADTWDESIIYSPVRITVAPIVVLFGLLVIVYGIFKGKKGAKEEEYNFAAPGETPEK